MLQKKALFLTLNTFSSTGGIEKVCCIAGKALHEIANEGGHRFQLYSMYDKPGDLIEKYLPKASFRPFSGNRVKFVKEAVSNGCKCDTVILSHINLLGIGFLIKMLSPKTKVFLLAHGIEVWKPLPLWKKLQLKKLDLILPVSEFTRQKMQSLYGISSQKMEVLNNCLDPFLEKKLIPAMAPGLKEKYGFGKADIVLFTLTRLKSSEQYKGYDKVIEALPAILKNYPHVKYLVAGKYDKEEKKRLDELITGLQLNNQLLFTGFLAEEEIEACFTLADVYIMPSSGEGFGIVFIEALFYGKPVIAGNRDGSVDALNNGQFGLLIDPFKKEEIIAAVGKILDNKAAYIPEEKEVTSKFGYETYKSNLERIVSF